jgi:hypothetical protein
MVACLQERGVPRHKRYLLYLLGAKTADRFVQEATAKNGKSDET